MGLGRCIMGVEYEAKFLDVNLALMRKKLRQIGAKRVHPFKRMVRTTYDLCNGSKKKAFVRVRQEANRVTMTSKNMEGKFAVENEVEIKNTYEEGKAFLDSLDLNQTAYQITYREKWTLPNVNEIVFDMIPGIPIYMEIDCATEKMLNQTVSKLGLNMHNAKYGAFAKQYHSYYDIDPYIIDHKTPSLTFEGISREIKPSSLVHKKLLKQVQMQQLSFIKSLGVKTAKKVTRKRKKSSKRTQKSKGKQYKTQNTPNK